MFCTFHLHSRGYQTVQPHGGLPVAVKTQSVGCWPRLVAVELFVGSLPPGNRQKHKNLTINPFSYVQIASVAAAIYEHRPGFVGHRWVSESE